MTQTRQIRLPSGTVHATVSDGVLDARGVRYGSAGGARGESVEAPRVAQSEPAAFPQVPGLLDGLLGPALGELDQSEDAFTVRIQAPDLADGQTSGQAERLPVLLFVHGGGFTTGSAESRWYDAADLVRRGRFVLVTVNHRLGVLGTVATGDDTSPAFGDLVAASRWVHAHVAAFGGDPNMITVAGDSAGAWWAQALSTSPATAGLFRRTVLISMPRMAPLSGADAHARRTAVAHHLTRTGRKDVLAAPVVDLLAAQRAAAGEYRGAGFPFAPAASAHVLPALGDPSLSAAAVHTDEVLCLTTAHEASAFLLPRGPASFTDAWVQEFAVSHFADPDAARAALTSGQDAFADAVALQTHWQFQSTVQEFASAARVPVRLARLDVASPMGQVGATHCFTLPFLFGERTAWRDAPMLEGIAPALFEKTRDAVQSLVVEFVHGRETPAPCHDPTAPQLWAIGPEQNGTLPLVGAQDWVHCPAGRQH